MSIFKGDSIYKSGGGSGGGYSDGGALVDADFIEVTNNSISTYDNTSRDPVNFYFEVSDGEMINSVIELTTAVNATINVYVVKNGLYYLLSNIGGNTVTAGEEYKVNITGDSYSVEQLSAPTNPLLYVFGQLLPIVKIGNKYWTAENMYSTFDGLVIGGPGQNTTPGAWWYQNDPITYGHNGNKYNLYYNTAAAKYINNNVGNGWHIPTKQEFQNLIASVGSDVKKISNWSTGTNETGFSAVPSGNRDTSLNWYSQGTQAAIMYTEEGAYGRFSNFTIDGPVYYNAFSENDARFVSIRLCKDA